MDMPWGSPGSNSFVKNVGLVTSNGPNGHDIMSAEWAYQISYSPAIIAISIGPERATAENIIGSKEFGVSIAAEDQNIISSVSGGVSGKDVDKISVLKELGAEFYSAKLINALMVKGSRANFECRLIKHEKFGDHILFIGEVLEFTVAEGKVPVAYYSNKYWKFGNNMPRPNEETIARIKSLFTKYKKQGAIPS